MSSGSRDDKQAEAELVLFVTGDSPRSTRARANLLEALKSLETELHPPREIDLTQDPEPALEYGIFASPALMYRKSGNRPAVLYGDLSDRDSLYGFLADIARSGD